VGNVNLIFDVVVIVSSALLVWHCDVLNRTCHNDRSLNYANAM